jgi:hypothetical protein
MRPRTFIWAGLVALTGVGSVLTYTATRGQPTADPPRTLPPELHPSTKTVVPAGAVSAATPAPGRKTAPFDRFRKYDELPELTRQIVFATKLGMEWLSRDGIHQPNGRFVPGLDPALGKATEDDHFLRQALGAFALARAAKLTGEEKYAVRAGQTILSLLAETPKDTANPAMRKPVQRGVICNRVGAAAILALAIYELPEAPADLVQCGEELCQFLRTSFKPDGSVQFAEPGESADPDGANLYPGPALLAVAMSNRVAPADWKTAALARGLGFYRKQFQAGPHPAFASWMVPAFAEMYVQTREQGYADFVFEMTDWLRQLQYDSPERSRAAWRGGFPAVAGGKVVHTAPTVETAYAALALADACRMIRHMDRPDAARYDQYRTTLTRALQFLTTLQYGEDSTMHFAAHFRPALVGAFHPSLSDGTLRVDHTAVAVAALSQYLIAGADR